MLDNDRFEKDLRRCLERLFGVAGSKRYWTLFERLRRQLGYADYLGALQLYRRSDPHNERWLEASEFLIEYPFARRLYSGALNVLAHLDTLGTTVLLSDGDAVFQPLKIRRSGLFKAVGGRVLITTHKERELGTVERCYPRAHYVLVDDKPRIISAVKKRWKDRVTTIHVNQGHYAHSADAASFRPRADIQVERIRDLPQADLSALAKKISS